MRVYDSIGDLVTWYLEDVKITFEYDSDGKVKQQIQWKKGQIEIRSRFRYKVDERGNWIERYKSLNYPNVTNAPVRPDEWIEVSTVYRETEYYY